MIWEERDPRHTIYKRAKIIIIKPNIDGRSKLDIGIGDVETKNGYSIWTSFLDYNQKPISIHEGDDWDKDWKWIRFPEYMKDIDQTRIRE